MGVQMSSCNVLSVFVFDFQFVAGYDVTGRTATGVAEARKRIGFCSQVDPLLDLMTGRETLRLFGSLRGIPWDQLVRILLWY